MVSKPHGARRIVLTLVVATALFALSASAAWGAGGNFLATGHDAELHCYGGSPGPQCHYFAQAVKFVRAGSTNPALPVLILDNNSHIAGGEVATALDKSTTAGFFPAAVPRVVVDPSSPAFLATAFDPTTFSAIIVASDSSCGGCDLNQSGTNDSDAINTRSGDIATFLNNGGGLLYLAGAGNGDTAAGVYYKSVPIPVAGAPVTNPFTLTPAGQALGFEDSSATPPIGTHNDINCCATHNSFNLPAAGSPLQVAETDSAGLAETIFAQSVSICASGFCSDTIPPTSTAAVPTCSTTGAIVVTVTDEAGGSGAKAVHFKLDGGAEQVVATSGQPGTATITVPAGTHSLEYWGEDVAGNQESPHHTASVVVDNTKPTVSITSSSRKYRQHQKAFVTIKATDETALSPNPSGRSSISTSKTGRHMISRTATDACKNSTTASFTYTVAKAKHKVKAVKKVVKPKAKPRFTG